MAKLWGSGARTASGSQSATLRATPPPPKPAPMPNPLYQGGIDPQLAQQLADQTLGPAGPTAAEQARLAQLQQAGMAATKGQIEQDLARQLAQSAEQMRWRQMETGKAIGRLEEEAPKRLGDIASGYAARGAYHSSGRTGAQDEVSKQIAAQIDSMRHEQNKAQIQTEWEQTEARTRAQRAMEDLQRQEEANRLEQQVAARSSSRSGGSGSGGGGGARIDQDSYRSEATSFRDARQNIYRSQGYSAADAQAMSMHDMAARYPHLDQTWLFAGTGGKPIEQKAPTWKGVAVGAERAGAITPAKRADIMKRDSYKAAASLAQQYMRAAGGAGTPQGFMDYAKGALGTKDDYMINNAHIFSLAFANAR